MSFPPPLPTPPPPPLCQICGDPVGRLDTGHIFIACALCSFPVCRPCYEYERKEGTQICPHCRTRYKRHAGSERIPGDEEDDDFPLSDREQSVHDQVIPLHSNNYGISDAEDSSKQIVPSVPIASPFPTKGNAEVMSAPAASNVIGSRPIQSVAYPESFSSSSTTTGSLDRGREFSKDEFLSSSAGDVAWKDRVQTWKLKRGGKMDMVMAEGDVHKLQAADDIEELQDESDEQVADAAKQALSRKIPLPSVQINPYRMVIVLRFIILAFFIKYRIQNPVQNAYGLWLTSVICEIWFSLAWILDQLPKWKPVNRETYLDRLSLRFEPEGLTSRLAPVDIFVGTVDPFKEPSLVTANTILSILAVDYPVDKISCYISDDGAAMVTFEVLSETSEFARKWVPFCKKFSIEPRAPEVYFAQKIDYLKDKVQPTFVKERRAMKREYEEFKVKINAMVAKAQKVPEEGWMMEDGTLWPGNSPRDHPGMIQVFLGQSGSRDSGGNELPRLVYVSREKRPGIDHQTKAGAMNGLVRVSAVLTNAPCILNLDYDHYINNSKALRESMCYMMDPIIGRKVCYVQFPQRFDGIDLHDRYANHNTVFFDINMRGLDGVQGPVYLGTGCVFRRQALYGLEAPKTNKARKDAGCFMWCCGERKRSTSKFKLKTLEMDHPAPSDTSAPVFQLESLEDRAEGLEDVDRALLFSQKGMERRFGQSAVFTVSTFYEDGGVPESVSTATLLKEAIHVISCGYEDKTEWGKEIGWIYGSVRSNLLTGFMMHSRGWRSIYCMPSRPAFKGSAPINISDRLNQVQRWALGSVEILLSKHCPIWYGYGSRLKLMERLAYVNAIVYPLTSIPLIVYCILPAVCLLTGKFIIPQMTMNFASLWILALLLISIFATAVLEMRWGDIGIDEWWRNEQFWVIGGVSAHLFALFQGLVKLLVGIDAQFASANSKPSRNHQQLNDFQDLYLFKWTTLLIPPTTLLIINIVGIVAGISQAVDAGYQSWSALVWKFFFAMWVIFHLYPFLKGLLGRQNRTPTIVIVWAILLASIFSLLWVKIDPFVRNIQGPSAEACGNLC